MDQIASKLSSLEKQQILEFAPKLLELLSTKTMANEANEYATRKVIADAYSYNEEYSIAARTLSDLHVDQLKE